MSVRGTVADFIYRRPRLWGFVGEVIRGKGFYPDGRIGAILLSRPGAWLDFGCGIGQTAWLFPPNGYLGVDSKEERLRIARRRHPRHRFEQATIEKLEGWAESFDGVFLSQVLHHMDPGEVERLLTACFRCLRPGGLCVAVELAPVSPGETIRHNLPLRLEDPPNLQLASFWRDELERAGFVTRPCERFENARLHAYMLVAERPPGTGNGAYAART